MECLGSLSDTLTSDINVHLISVKPNHKHNTIHDILQVLQAEKKTELRNFCQRNSSGVVTIFCFQFYFCCIFLLSKTCETRLCETISFTDFTVRDHLS